ncbi:lipase chaperone [Noviherbaspirillum sp. 17J57-3]|uniref:Lipase helper protein n=2 Tax=Noviherbaspirillum galbum TaxID=2709383 RepID=A0A6B3SH43_9BURK|nr:lipase chaperone [Noviherbaspirillum galbum]
MKLIGLAGAGAAAVLAVSLVAGRGDAPPAPVRHEKDAFSFVRSLEGTEPDGKLAFAGNQAGVASAELLRFFEYYLSAIGEKEVPAIRAAIESEIDRQLPPERRLPARDVLRRYLDYKLALVDVEQQQRGESALGMARARYSAMQDTRRRFFNDAEIEAMFRESDAYDRDALARMEIDQDPDASLEQKRERLAALDAALPPALREAKLEPFAVARMDDEVRAMRAGGASDDEIYRKRAQAFSPDAAARLAQVDRDEQEWKRRVDAYLMQRTQAGPALDAQALQHLRDEYFTQDEQRRLAAYEQR